jgi:TetR/AcrR family transcriptional regulator, transcriptional repressor of aconitase
MPKRSPEHMRERRKQILDAAIECVLKKGWARTTVDDVATRARLSKGGIYVHFANKRELLVGIAKRNIEEIETLANLSTFKDLRRMLLAGINLLASPRGHAIATSNLEFQLEAARDPELQQIFRAGAARLIEVFSRVVQRLRPDLAASEASTTALTLILLIEGIRSFRVLSDAVSKTQLRGAIERQLKTLRR